MVLQRVLLAINVRWWNAEAAYAVNVARGLIKQGIQVWIIVNQNSPAHHKVLELGIPAITEIALDSLSPISHWKNFIRLLHLLDQNKIQVINSFKSNGSFIFSLARYFRPGVLYIKTRGEARPPKMNLANTLIYGTKACDGIIAVGNQVRQWICKLKIDDQNVRTIYFGDSGLKLKSSAESMAVRQRLNISVNTRVLALIGRTQTVKGHLILLKAFEILRERDLYLLFLVKDLGEFPKELRMIENFIEKKGLEKRVTILGFQKNLGKIVSGVDLGIVSSLASEVICRVAVEFFSLAIPVLAFPVGCLPEVVQHGKNGYVCEATTAEELVKGIKWMTENETRLKQTGQFALESYRENYSLKQLATETLEFYQYCSSKKHRQ